MAINRRTFISSTAAVIAIGSIAGGASAEEGDTIPLEKLMKPAGPQDRSLGAADAKITLIEYASPTCPHCAKFHVETYPELKRTYVEAGQVRLVVRPFVRNVPDAVVFLLAYASIETAYFDLIEAFFKTQEQWSTSEAPKTALEKIAFQHGFTQESFDAALKDQAGFDALEAARDQAMKEFHLTGTPTFYINGKHRTGALSLEELATEFEPLLRA